MLRLWLACLLIGICAAVIAVLVDLIAQSAYELRVGMCEAASPGRDRYVVWLASAALSALVATGLLKVVPAAAGSGLPEVKEAMSGIILFDSFSSLCLLIKPLSLALAIASSLSIGKEGPFIHCACCVAYLLVNGGWIRFSSLVKEQRELEGLVAACAAGVVCTFGAPVGGVLFSAEITSTGSYSIEHLPRAFFCVTLSLAFVLTAARPILLNFGQRDPLSLFTTSFEPHEFSPFEILAFALQGVLAALVSALVLKAVQAASVIRPWLKRDSGIFAPSVVAMLCSACNLALSSGQCRGVYTDGGSGTLGKLLSRSPEGANGSLPDVLPLPTQSMLILVIFGLVKLYLLSPLSLAMPTPTGVFLPTFVGGAALGSAYGSALRSLLPSLFASSLPGHFAVTGAAAVACASTRTMSTAVVTIELTGQLSLQIPVLVATTTSYLVARLLGTPSLFDAFVAIKKLPGATTKGVPLSADGPLSTSSLTLNAPPVQKHLEHIAVPRHVSRRQLSALLQESSSGWVFSGVSLVPIVRSAASPYLLGCIHADILHQLAAEPVSRRSSVAEAEEEDAPRRYSLNPPTRVPPMRMPPTRMPAKYDDADQLLRGERGLGALKEPLVAADALGEVSGGGRVGGGADGGGGVGGARGGASSTIAAVAGDDLIDILEDSHGFPRDGVDLAPLTVTPHARLARLSSLLRLLGASTAFVVAEGLLVGYATRVTLFHVESHLFDEKDRNAKGRLGSSPSRASISVADPPRGGVEAIQPVTQGATTERWK